METKQDRAVGIIPVYQTSAGGSVFCIVQEADGHWGFPKGHVERGESDEQAARRELSEETGIAEAELVQEKTFSEHYSFERDGVRYDKEVTYFIGRVASILGTTPAQFKKEILAAHWAPLPEAQRILTFPEAKEVLAAAQKYLESEK